MTAPLGSAQMSDLARDLHRMGRAGRRRLRQRMGDLAQPVLTDARSRAGWSTRIPGALSVRPVTRGDAVGVALRAAAGENAPHARVYEGIGGGSYFRHPVFGRPGGWVAQSTRPYALPAVRANEGRAAQACADAFEDAAREVGFS